MAGKKTEDGKRKTEDNTDTHGPAQTGTEERTEPDGRGQADGVDYPVMVCPGCGMTDNVVEQNGRTRAPEPHTRIRRCRQCDMRFKEHVP